MGIAARVAADNDALLDIRSSTKMTFFPTAGGSLAARKNVDMGSGRIIERPS